MRLRYAFLSKIVILAVISSSPAFAGDGEYSHAAAADHHAPAGNSHDPAVYYTQDPHELAQMKHNMAHWAMQSFAHGNKAFAEYKKIENSILSNPLMSLDKLVELSNKHQHQYTYQSNHTEHGKTVTQKKLDGRLFIVNVQYRESLPSGELSTVQLTEGSGDKVMMTIITHEKAKTNPFVLLEALVKLSEVFDISTISGNQQTIKPGTSFFHHNYGAFETHIFNLSKSLGISNIGPAPGTYSHQLGTWIRPVTPMELAELRANAAAGSAISQRTITENDTKAFQRMKASFATFLPIKNMTADAKRAALAEYAKLKGVGLDSSSTYEVMLQAFQDKIDIKNKRDLESINELAKRTYRTQMKSYKDGAAAREEVVQNKSLSEMVKANDRAGVASAMETMLPWEIMEPTEKVFWKEYVDAIRNPNYEGAPILFRGIDHQEKLQSVTDSKGNIIGGGLFSKRLTAGSGSHLFKLKGLVETFETFGTDGVNSRKSISPLNQPHTLTKMMLNHAANPQGSPFISLTYNLEIAYSFGNGMVTPKNDPTKSEKAMKDYLNSNASGGVATLRIDKRRIITNSVSGFTHEIEVLASMLIFPDEVLYLEKGVYFYGTGGEVKRISKEDYYKNARDIVYRKTGQVLPESYLDYSFNGQKAFFNGFSEMELRLRKVYPNQPGSCGKVFN
ncbi:hypothetical protein [Bdellovibrio sp. HCB209]|uniref:hypothetical protein n=1 Tax=Bdellovibrio sp. HCB209 TaxID=3394354 RepID=UPI0039B6160A